MLALAATVGALTGVVFAQEGGEPEVKPEPPPRAGRRGRFIEAMDADKDGQVTLEEFKTFHINRLDEQFKRMDRNEDGVITAEDRPSPEERQQRRRQWRERRRGGENADAEKPVAEAE